MSKFILWGALSLQNAWAFSLLGPYAEWMDIQKSYHQPGDIGGPMNIGEGYRWNVPIITYGFERSFLDYFGSNGVAAVEGAVQFLNLLPPASSINLAQYPTDVWRYNYQAQAANLWDLKSAVLGLLLEQLGLASPERFTFCVRDFSGSETDGQYVVIQRNFDPITAQPSRYVNDTLVSYFVTRFATPDANGVVCDAIEFPVDPAAPFITSVAGNTFQSGQMATNLSRDDIGGLRYLLNAGLIRYEYLLPDVESTDGASLVRATHRPGLEKISLVRHPVSALTGVFQPFTNRWTDVYFDGDGPAYQSVQRVTSYPDIVFRAADLGFYAFQRTGTSNWVNNAELNGNPGGAGPGIIRPPITITLNNAGPMLLNFGLFNLDESTASSWFRWGSFDSGTNQVIAYPAGLVSFQPTTVHFNLMVAGRTSMFQWPANTMAYRRCHFQTSTNLSDWNTLTSFTNTGAGFSYTFLGDEKEAVRYFRTIAD